MLPLGSYCNPAAKVYVRISSHGKAPQMLPLDSICNQPKAQMPQIDFLTDTLYDAHGGTTLIRLPSHVTARLLRSACALIVQYSSCLR